MKIYRRSTSISEMVKTFYDRFVTNVIGETERITSFRKRFQFRGEIATAVTLDKFVDNILRTCKFDNGSTGDGSRTSRIFRTFPTTRRVFADYSLFVDIRRVGIVGSYDIVDLYIR